MPQNTAQNTPSDTAPKDQGCNRFIKNAGYSNMSDFMLSHGLRISNNDDVQEAKAIREGLRGVPQADWEEKARK